MLHQWAELAPAKVNLFLQVLGPRLDGYHDLVSVMTTVGLCDVVAVEPVESTPDVPDAGVTVFCAFPGVPGGAENICHAAAHALWRDAAQKRGDDDTDDDEGGDGVAGADVRAVPSVYIRVKKRIPVGAGLGGGSADAAAALRALNRMWRLGYDAGALRRVAVALGSDVPFCVRGGAAVVVGRGEELREFGPCAPFWVAIIDPGFAVATADAYRWLDEWRRGGRQVGAAAAEGHATAPEVDAAAAEMDRAAAEAAAWRVATALARGDLAVLAQSARNSFQPALEARFPALRRIREAAATRAATAMLTGSGAAVVAVARDRRGALAAARAATATGLVRRFWVAPHRPPAKR